jgi:hypothetical protein
MSTTEIDEVILPLVGRQWQKVAMIVAKAQRECEQRHIAITYEDIGRRIAALVSAGAIEARGNVSRWRESEVRLLPS